MNKYYIHLTPIIIDAKNKTEAEMKYWKLVANGMQNNIANVSKDMQSPDESSK